MYKTQKSAQRLRRILINVNIFILRQVNIVWPPRMKCYHLLRFTNTLQLCG